MKPSVTTLLAKLPKFLLGVAATCAAVLFGAMAGCQSTPAKPAAAPVETVANTPVVVVADAPRPECSAKRVKPQEAIAAAYAYQPAQGQVLRWEEGAVETTPARAGGIVNVAAQVSLIGAAGTTPLTVRVRLVQGEKTIAELGAHTFLCNDGAWRCVQGLALPGNVPPGAFVLQVECATARAQAVGAIPLAVQ